MPITVPANQPATPASLQLVSQGRGVNLVAAALLASYTPPADASFLVVGNVRTISGTTYSFSLVVSWTDETGQIGTRTLPSFLGGYGSGVLANTDGFQSYSIFPLSFRVKKGTTISVSATGTFTSVVYNAEAEIMKISD